MKFIYININIIKRRDRVNTESIIKKGIQKGKKLEVIPREAMEVAVGGVVLRRNLCDFGHHYST